MADILERKIPYLFPGDLELRLDAQNFVTAISGYPVGGGGGTIVESDFIWKPVINQDGTIGWERDTSATTPATANLVPHIYNNYWYVGTSNTNVEARGPQGNPGADGTNGTDGKDGKDGISPTVTTATIEGGNRVIFTYGEGSTESIDVMSGASGAKGSDGYSPTVTVTNIPADPDDPNHKNGGTEITITDATTTNKFSAWNGNDGTMAGAPGIEGNNGISALLDGSTYKVGLSAAFYTAVTSVSSKLNTSTFDTYTATTAPGAFQPKGDYASASDISDMATKTWVGTQGFLTNSDLTDYATKTYAETASANAYSEAVAQIPDVTDFITKDADDLTYYYKKTETSAKEELSAEFVNKVNKPNTSLTDKYLVLRTDTNGAVSGWCDYNDKIYSKSESDLRYMQKNTDSTLSGNGTTNSPLGLDMTNAYTIDGINGITAVPDSTSNKVIVKMTDDAWGYYQHLAASASEWDKISGLSAKSNVNITSAGVTTVTNTSGTTENKFTQYAEVASHPTPRMFLCATADTVADISGVLTAASGMGAVIFVIESHS